MDYLNYIFELILNTSIKGAMLVIFIIAFQSYFRDSFSAKWIYSLWLLVLVRLFVPRFPLKTPFSLYNYTFFDRYEPLIGQTFFQKSSYTFIDSSFEISQIINKANTFSLFDYLSIIWILGVIILTLILIGFKRRLNLVVEDLNGNHPDMALDSMKKSLNISGEIKVLYTHKMVSPFVFGFIAPKIVVSESLISKLRNEEIKYVIMHELVHIKRKDNFYNTLGLVACILNWFNPFIWMGYLRSKKDCELACDESVLDALKAVEYKTYGRTLLNIIELISFENAYMSIYAKHLINNRSEANQRILQAVNFKKRSKLITIISLLVLVIISGLSLTDHISTLNDTKILAHSLPYYLDKEEHEIRDISGHYPEKAFLIKQEDRSYFLLYYQNFGNDYQFCFDGDIGNRTRPTLEITTDLYKGLKQEMKSEDALKRANDLFGGSTERVDKNNLSMITYNEGLYKVSLIFDNDLEELHSISMHH